MKTDKRGYIYLGSEYANQEFEPFPQKDGSLVLKPVVTMKIAKEDAWFLNDKWQKGERAVEQHLTKGEFVSEASADDLFTS